MERLRALSGDLSQYLSQLTRREKMLVSLAALSVVVFVGSIVTANISRSITRHELSIEDKVQSLGQVSFFAQTYSANERTRRELEGRLGGPPVRLLSHMQELATKHGLEIGSMSDKGDQTADKVKESMVDVQFKPAPIEKLTPLLNEIERNPHIIKVKKLRMKRVGTGEDKNLLMSLVVATYQLADAT